MLFSWFLKLLNDHHHCWPLIFWLINQLIAAPMHQASLQLLYKRNKEKIKVRSGGRCSIRLSGRVAELNPPAAGSSPSELGRHICLLLARAGGDQPQDIEHPGRRVWGGEHWQKLQNWSDALSQKTWTSNGSESLIHSAFSCTSCPLCPISVYCFYYWLNKY